MRLGGGAAKTNKIEMRKEVPARFPSNEDSIGIELVGRAVLPPNLIKPGMSAKQIAELRNEKGVFETVTPAQNVSLKRLISELQTVLDLSKDEVYPHARVSAKNPTEASTAQWPGKK